MTRPVARYQDFRDRIVSVADEVFAEPIFFSPMKKQVQDPDRLTLDIEGVLRVGGGQDTAVATARANDWRSRIVAGKAELHIDWTRYPDLVARKGDRIRAVSRPQSPWFEVLSVDDRTFTRLVLQLGEI